MWYNLLDVGCYWQQKVGIDAEKVEDMKHKGVRVPIVHSWEKELFWQQSKDVVTHIAKWRCCGCDGMQTANEPGTTFRHAYFVYVHVHDSKQ